MMLGMTLPSLKATGVTVYQWKGGFEKGVKIIAAFYRTMKGYICSEFSVDAKLELSLIANRIKGQGMGTWG